MRALAPKPDTPGTGVPTAPLRPDEIVSMLDAAEIGYILCDGRGVPILVSPAFRVTAGLAPDDPMPEVPWFRADSAPEAIKSEREVGWRMLMHARTDWRGWVRWHRPDGEVRVLEGTARVLDDERVLLISNDRTDRFEVTRALAETEKAQRAILDDLPLSVALQDPEGRFLYVNNYLPRRLNVDRKRIIGRKSSQVGIRPEPAVEDMLRLARERAEPLTGRIVRVEKGPLGGTEWAFYGVPILDRDGSLRQYLSVAAERTAEVQLTREREEFAQAIGRTQRIAALNDFAGALAHELSNLLHPVGTYARRLARDPDRTDRAELAARIEAAAMTAGRILRRTLMMGRSEDDRPAQVAIRPLVTDVLDTARDLAPRALAYRFECDGDPQGVLQSTEFRQVLLNLLNNAAEAQHYAGEIGVTVTEGHDPPMGLRYRPMASGPFVQVTISDQGSGVPDGEQTRIFEPFYTTKREGRGTGLGLPVALGLVTGWGGTISVRNRPGGGARFTIWIPQRASKGETPCPPS